MGNATNITAGAKCIVALAGVTLATGKEVSEGKVGGVESVGTFCDSKMMGWDTDVLEENMAVILDDDSPIRHTRKHFRLSKIDKRRQPPQQHKKKQEKLK